MISKRNIPIFFMILILLSILTLNFIYDRADAPKDGKKTSVKIGISIYSQYDTYI